MDALTESLWAPSLRRRLARDRPRFPLATAATPAPTASTTAPPQSTAPPQQLDILELVKFICKDVWISLFDKQVDNLRTNHRGVYVVSDNAFASLNGLSPVSVSVSVSGPPLTAAPGAGTLAAGGGGRHQVVDPGAAEEEEERKQLHNHVEAVRFPPAACSFRDESLAADKTLRARSRCARRAGPRLPERHHPRCPRPTRGPESRLGNRRPLHPPSR